MYKVEKLKEDTWEPWKLRSHNFSMTSEEFLWTKNNWILLSTAVSLYMYIYNMIFDSC